MEEVEVVVVIEGGVDVFGADSFDEADYMLHEVTDVIFEDIDGTRSVDL